ncbi:hypothetical protein [Methylosinus trichosporium]|uniref:O-antigen ligase domain-containing protein n=1 Tax=Methylosinus trichosporium (strain ATCC 35070 / NCIMB 11131 / UNIQEM 75 / OB3b) TaxID=595536 RepID=A0A2D2D367_METT3|nr:hypothetical protein [Methylosinus trichosporium]ATQ69309.1 hypothetical protein CQW49_16540 [Methylosinus trichosporium OB3b]
MPNLSRRTIDDPATEAARLLARLSIMLLFIISQVAPILARQTIYILLPIGAALLLLSASLAPDSRRLGQIIALALKPTTLAALFFVGWTGLSLAWTPFGSGPAERFGKSAATLALVAAACALLPARTKTSNLNLLPIGTAAAAGALLAVALLAHPLAPPADLDSDPLQRAGLGLALVLWPALGALALRGRWISAGVVAAAAVAACALARSPAALPALIVGALVLALSFGKARRVSRLLALLAATAILVAPLAAILSAYALPEHPPAALEPLLVWGHILIGDGPRALLGHGFGAAIYGVLGHYLDQETPRSLVFQVWFDLGAIGALALAAVAARAFIIAGRTRPVLAPFLLAGLATGLAISMLGPAGEQLWWLTLAGLDAIAFALVMKGQFRNRRPYVQPNWAVGRIVGR